MTRAEVLRIENEATKRRNDLSRAIDALRTNLACGAAVQAATGRLRDDVHREETILRLCEALSVLLPEEATP